MFRSFAFGFAFFLAGVGAASADLLWGVNGHPFTAYPGTGLERQLDYIRDLGIKSYRVNIGGISDVEKLEVLVREGKRRGIAILPVITPGLDLDKESLADLYEKSHKLANTLGSYFKDDIRVWELGNEMENYAIIKPCEKRDDGTEYPCAWGPAGGVDALDYYGPRWAKVSAVLKGLSVGMTDADPTIRKAMGTAGWGHTGAFDRMSQDGIAWDISVWHMYGEDPEWAFEKLAVHDRPIWVTEFNNPYGSQRDEQQQAEGLEKAMLGLRQLQQKYKIEAAYIYELLDEPYWAPDFEAYMGLVRVTGSTEAGWRAGEPKPAYNTVRQLIRGERQTDLPKRGCDMDAMRSIEPIHFRQANFGLCLMLGRNGTTDEVDKWAAELDSGKASYVDMLSSLMGSSEFSERYGTYGMSDRAYVNFLYVLLVGRPADNDGLDSYAKQLREGTMARDYVALGMITSSEFSTKHAALLTNGQPPG